MNEAIGSNEIKGQDCERREGAANVAKRLAEGLERQALAYRFIERAITELEPDIKTEAAIWQILMYGQRSV